MCIRDRVYHELFDEALAAYNAKKKKTRDKIPDYYEHIRQSKQEKLFHEAIFQIGNMAVSYTHLDVYKRQVTWRTVGAAPQEGNGQRQRSKNLQSPSRLSLIHI